MSIPYGWAKAHVSPSTPNGPAEYDVDFVYGDDPPEPTGWTALYREREVVKTTAVALLDLLGDRNNNGGLIRDMCFTAFMQAKRPNSECGGESDWFNDTLPTVNAGIEKIRTILAALSPSSGNGPLGAA